MSFKKLTISYDDFQDEENGLVPYLASAIVMLIRKDDMETLQELMNNIAKVADQMFDLNDEAVAKKKDYDKLQNRLAAIQADLAKKEEAQAAIQEQMKQLVGKGADEYSDTMEPAEARDISEIVSVESVEYDPLSELDMALGDLESDDLSGLSELTVEKVMVNQNVPEALRKAGIVFGDEIDKLAMQHEEEVEELEEDVYADFDLQVEDVDQGYMPVPDEPSSNENLSFDNLFGDMPASAESENTDDEEFFDDYSEYDDNYDDLDIFDTPDPSESSSEKEPEQNDEYDEIDFDEDFVDDGYLESADDIFAPSPSSSAQEPPSDDDDDDDNMTSGIVDLDLFK